MILRKSITRERKRGGSQRKRGEADREEREDGSNRYRGNGTRIGIGSCVVDTMSLRRKLDGEESVDAEKQENEPTKKRTLIVEVKAVIARRDERVQ